jgi:hypothetical protein
MAVCRSIPIYKSTQHCVTFQKNIIVPLSLMPQLKLFWPCYFASASQHNFVAECTVMLWESMRFGRARIKLAKTAFNLITLGAVSLWDNQSWGQSSNSYICHMLDSQFKLYPSDSVGIPNCCALFWANKQQLCCKVLEAGTVKTFLRPVIHQTEATLLATAMSSTDLA